MNDYSTKDILFYDKLKYQKWNHFIVNHGTVDVFINNELVATEKEIAYMVHAYVVVESINRYQRHHIPHPINKYNKKFWDILILSVKPKIYYCIIYINIFSYCFNIVALLFLHTLRLFYTTTYVDNPAIRRLLSENKLIIYQRHQLHLFHMVLRFNWNYRYGEDRLSSTRRKGTNAMRAFRRFQSQDCFDISNE